MKEKNSSKDALVLMLLSIITIAGIGFFVLRLWFPNLLDSQEEEGNGIVEEEEIYDDSDIPKISIEELKNKLDNNEDIILVDVQNTEDFINSSIPTSISIPLTEIDQRYIELPKNKEIIASDAGGNCQECSRAVEILRDNGFIDVKKLIGGVNAWADAGYPVISGSDISFQNINSDGLLDLVDASEDMIIIDVRDENEYYESHIKGAIHVPFQGLSENIDNITKDKKIIIYDNLGNRSKVAVEQFVLKGYINVENLLRGFDDWKDNNYPVESN